MGRGIVLNVRFRRFVVLFRDRPDRILQVMCGRSRIPATSAEERNGDRTAPFVAFVSISGIAAATQQTYSEGTSSRGLGRSDGGCGRLKAVLDVQCVGEWHVVVTISVAVTGRRGGGGDGGG